MKNLFYLLMILSLTNIHFRCTSKNPSKPAVTPKVTIANIWFSESIDSDELSSEAENM